MPSMTGPPEGPSEGAEVEGSEEAGSEEELLPLPELESEPVLVPEPEELPEEPVLLPEPEPPVLPLLPVLPVPMLVLPV